MKTSKYTLAAMLVVSISLLTASAALAGGGTRPGSGTTHNPKKGPGSGVTNAINNANKTGISSTTVLGNPGLSNSINTVNKFGSNNVTTVYGAGHTVSNGFPGVSGTTIYGSSLGNGFTVTEGGGNLPKEPGNNPNKGCDHDGCCHDGCNYDCHKYCRYDYCRPYCFSMCSPVMNNSYVVLPGDTFETISTKVYGVPSSSTYIATYNHMPVNATLVAGERLMLPSVGPNSGLSASFAPLATSLAVAAN